MDDQNPRLPKRPFKGRITRFQFIVLNVIFLVVFGGSFIFLLLEDPADTGLMAGIIVVWMIAGFVIRIFRFNDISAETQKGLLGSGNMFLTSGWLALIAPSASSSEGQLQGVAAAMGDKSTRMRLMGRNFLRLLIVYAIFIAGILAYNHFLIASHEKAAQNLPPKTANFVLSLGSNGSTTLSMTVPGEYSTNGFITPFFSTGKDTPSISFYSEPATEGNLNNAVRQTIANTETQVHYLDGSKLTATDTTSTFLGYPAWVITSVSDRPAKTIVFQVGSSTNMIEIEIIYSPTDPASEHQQVEGIINSMKIVTSTGI